VSSKEWCRRGDQEVDEVKDYRGRLSVKCRGVKCRGLTPVSSLPPPMSFTVKMYLYIIITNHHSHYLFLSRRI